MTKKYKFGILGTGWIARKMANAFKHVDGATLYAVASRNQQSANSFAKEFKIEKAYGSYEAMLADPEVDVVYVATPHNLHHQNTLLCLDYGKHVLCEKPFAVNGREAREMIDKARAKKLFLMEAMWSRFLPHIIKAKEIVESGQLGKIKLLTADFCSKFDFNPNNRWFNLDLVGGSLLDIGIYPVFLALYIMGKPQRLSALAGIGQTGVDYNCSMTFGYPDESIAVLHSSTIVSSGVNAAIYGENGSIVFDNWWFCPANFKVIDNKGKTKKYKIKSVGNGYNYEVDEVIRCLNNGQTQSENMSWQASLDLIDILDEIRKQGKIVYPNHDK